MSVHSEGDSLFPLRYLRLFLVLFPDIPVVSELRVLVYVLGNSLAFL